MPRSATIHRKTNETDVRLKLNLDGRGKSQVTTGIRFFDHMLDLVARHGAFDLEITAKGDLTWTSITLSKTSASLLEKPS